MLDTPRLRSRRPALVTALLPTLLATATLAGCASTPAIPVVANRSAYDNLLTRVAASGGAGLLGSGCVYYDEVGDDAILLGPATTLTATTAAQASRYLAGQGLPPAPLATPVTVPLCAGFVFPDSDKVLLRDTTAGDARPMIVSELYPTGQPPDAAGVREAIDRAFLLAFGDAFDGRVSRAAETPVPLPLALTAPELATLRAATGHGWVWLVTSVELVQSTAKVAAMDAARRTGLVGGLIGLSMQTGVRPSTQAALVDLATGTRVWRGQVFGPVPTAYNAAVGFPVVWGDVLFAPMLHTGVAPAGAMPAMMVNTPRLAAQAAAPVPVPAGAAVPPAPTPATTTTVTTVTTNPTPAATPPAATTVTTVVATPAPVPSPAARPALATITIKGRLAVHTLPRLDAPVTTLEPGTSLSILGMPTAVPDSTVHWINVGTPTVQGWATVPDVRTQY